MNTAAEKFAQLGVVPVVVLEDAKDAAPLAKALRTSLRRGNFPYRCSRGIYQDHGF